MSVAGRTAAIMQPTYLPYVGYLHLMAEADVFVFLDDVQFARRSWQSRNRIMTDAGEALLTVPVRKHARETPLAEIRIAEEEPWRAKHLAAIRQAYAGRPGLAAGMAFLEDQLSQPGDGTLAELNIRIAQSVADRIRLPTQFVRASTLSCGAARSEHLLAICRAVGATDYLSPMGSADYMTEDGVFAAAGFPVRFQGFIEIAYPQGREPFTPYMSFVDALMNLGWEGLTALVDHMRQLSATHDPAA
jgi:hypothetical protein